MRFTQSLLAGTFVALAASAAIPLKPILVSYPEKTADSIVTAAEDAIKRAGGEITHVYDIFQGFAANVPEKMVDAAVVKAGGATIEADSEYWAQPGKNGIS